MELQQLLDFNLLSPRIDTGALRTLPMAIQVTIAAAVADHFHSDMKKSAQESIRSKEDLRLLLEVLGPAFGFSVAAQHRTIAQVIDIYGYLLARMCEEKEEGNEKDPKDDEHEDGVAAGDEKDKQANEETANEEASPFHSCFDGSLKNAFVCDMIRHVSLLFQVRADSVDHRPHHKLIGDALTVVSDLFAAARSTFFTPESWQVVIRILFGCLSHTFETSQFAEVRQSLASVAFEVLLRCRLHRDEIWGDVASLLRPTRAVSCQWAVALVALSKAMTAICFYDKVPSDIVIFWNATIDNLRKESVLQELERDYVVYVWRKMWNVLGTSVATAPIDSLDAIMCGVRDALAQLSCGSYYCKTADAMLLVKRGGEASLFYHFPTHPSASTFTPVSISLAATCRMAQGMILASLDQLLHAMPRGESTTSSDLEEACVRCFEAFTVLVQTRELEEKRNIVASEQQQAAAASVLDIYCNVTYRFMTCRNEYVSNAAIRLSAGLYFFDVVLPDWFYTAVPDLMCAYLATISSTNTDVGPNSGGHAEGFTSVEADDDDGDEYPQVMNDGQEPIKQDKIETAHAAIAHLQSCFAVATRDAAEEGGEEPAAKTAEEDLQGWLLQLVPVIRCLGQDERFATLVQGVFSVVLNTLRHASSPSDFAAFTSQFVAATLDFLSSDDRLLPDIQFPAVSFLGQLVFVSDECLAQIFTGLADFATTLRGLFNNLNLDEVVTAGDLFEACCGEIQQTLDDGEKRHVLLGDKNKQTLSGLMNLLNEGLKSVTTETLRSRERALRLFHFLLRHATFPVIADTSCVDTQLTEVDFIDRATSIDIFGAHGSQLITVMEIRPTTENEEEEEEEEQEGQVIMIIRGPFSKYCLRWRRVHQVYPDMPTAHLATRDFDKTKHTPYTKLLNILENVKDKPESQQLIDYWRSDESIKCTFEDFRVEEEAQRDYSKAYGLKEFLPPRVECGALFRSKSALLRRLFFAQMGFLHPNTKILELDENLLAKVKGLDELPTRQQVHVDVVLLVGDNVTPAHSEAFERFIDALGWSKKNLTRKEGEEKEGEEEREEGTYRMYADVNTEVHFHIQRHTAESFRHVEASSRANATAINKADAAAATAAQTLSNVSSAQEVGTEEASEEGGASAGGASASEDKNKNNNNSSSSNNNSNNAPVDQAVTVRLVWDETWERHDWASTHNPVNHIFRHTTPQWEPSQRLDMFDLILTPFEDNGMCSVRLHGPLTLRYPTMPDTLGLGTTLFNGSLVPFRNLGCAMRSCVVRMSNVFAPERLKDAHPALLRRRAIENIVGKSVQHMDTSLTRQVSLML